MNISKKVISLTMVGLLLVSQLSFAGVSIQKGSAPLSSGKKIEAVKSGNHLIVPIKDVFVSLGASVAYEAKTKKITIQKSGKRFEFWVGKSIFKAQGKQLNMIEPIKLIKNSAYMPAQAVEQVMGVTLSYNNNVLQIGAASVTNLRVGTIAGPTGIAMAKLIDDSYIGENAKVTYDMEANAQLLPAKLLKKELDIAFVPTNMASIIYNKSKGDVVLLSSNIWGLLSVVSTDSTIKSWDDLKGKQVDLFGQGATPEIALKSLIEDHKMDPKKDVSYKMAYDTPGTLVAAMASGNTKDGIAVLAEPFTSMLLAKNKNANILFDVQTEWKKSFGVGFPMSSLVIRKAFLAEHPEVVSAFLREFADNLAYANANPQVIGKLVKKMPELPFEANVVAASIPRSDYKYQSAEDAKPALAKYLKVLYDFDPQSVGGKMPEDDFYVREVLINY